MSTATATAQEATNSGSSKKTTVMTFGLATFGTAKQMVAVKNGTTYKASPESALVPRDGGSYLVEFDGWISTDDSLAWVKILAEASAPTPVQGTSSVQPSPGRPAPKQEAAKVKSVKKAPQKRVKPLESGTAAAVARRLQNRFNNRSGRPRPSEQVSEGERELIQQVRKGKLTMAQVEATVAQGTLVNAGE